MNALERLIDDFETKAGECEQRAKDEVWSTNTQYSYMGAKNVYRYCAARIREVISDEYK